MSKELKNPEIVKDMDSLQAKIAVVREAQEKYANFTQEQVDKIFNAAATAANQMRIPLAQMAVEETGMGLVEDKVIKNNYAAEYIYNKYKNTKTCGVIDEDPAFGTKTIAEPLGLCSYPDDEPDVDRYFQDADLLKDQKWYHHQPAPKSEEVHYLCCEGRSRCCCQGRCSGEHHWLDR